MTNILVFNGQSETLVTTLSNKDNAMCPFSDATPIEQLNKDFTLEFSVPASHSDTQFLVRGNLVGYFDLDGNLQVFQIYKTEEEHNGDSLSKRVYSEHLFYEMNDDIVEDLRVDNGEALEAMTKALSASRWTVGTVDSLGLGTVNFYYSNGRKNLEEVVKTYGGELGFRFVLTGNTISQRLVDLKTRRGSDTGKRFEFTKDLNSVKRTVAFDGLKTALYGRGAGEQLETGGYSRKVTFVDVVWTVAGGDPVDKPAGQEWVGSPTALSSYGRVNGTRHRFGTFDSDTTDPAELLQQTWDELQRVSVPNVTYELSVMTLESIAGYEHEKVRLGDTVFVIDRLLGLTIEARVMEIRRDLVNPENTEIVLGNFIEDISDYNAQLEEVQAVLTDRQSIWDKADNAGGISEVDDGDIAIQPPVPPASVSATGLFKTIALSWTFDPSIKVSAYEVYASKVNNFTPDISNLVFRGKAGGFVHTGQTSETWYFRIRTLNPAGTASAFTNQFSASTLQIATADYANLSIGTAQIADLAVDNAKLGNLAVTNAKINDLSADKINAGLVKAQYVQIGSSTTFANGFNPNPSFAGIYDQSFAYGKSFWGDVYSGQLITPTTKGTVVDSTESSTGGKLLQLTNETWLYSMNPIPVNVNRKYKMTFRVRQTVDPTVAGKSKVYAGVVTLDKAFQNIIGGAGTHRYFCASAMDINSTMGWQTFEGTITGTGDLVDQFRVGTAYVRPMFLVNYQAGDGTVEVDFVKFEDVTDIDAIQTTLNDVSFRTTEDSILATVRSSVSYQTDLAEKASTSDLAGYATTDDMNSTLTDAKDYADGQVKTINDKLGVNPDPTKTIYQQISEVDLKADGLDLKFTNSGGVNQLKNSVGFAGTQFWTVALGSVVSIQNAELEAIGAGSGWFSDVGTQINLSQKAPISNSPTYTLSFYMKKEVDNVSTGWAGIDVYVGGVKQTFVGLGGGAGITSGYQKFEYQITTASSEVEIKLTVGTGAKATITNLMLNIGSVPLQWQNSSGELYTTNVQMDRLGVTVKSNVYDGYTIMSPTEFAGYAKVPDASNNLVMTKVFSLNKDVTEVSKLDADKEINMSPIKIVPVTTGASIGWAFVAE